jgi:hypothetical protein
MIDALLDVLLDPRPLAKISVSMPVTQESLDDADYVRGLIEERLRRADLARRGFLGLVRCERCHRATRCVFWIRKYGIDELYGPTCYRLERDELLAETPSSLIWTQP